MWIDINNFDSEDFEYDHRDSKRVNKIKNNSKLIQDTINQQKVYIQEMNEGMDQSQEKMGAAMKKIGQFLQTQNQSQIKVFMTLLCISVILFLVLLRF